MPSAAGASSTVQANDDRDASQMTINVEAVEVEVEVLEPGSD
jgi:hypothetical protein